MSINRAEFSVAVKSTFDAEGIDKAKSTFASLSAQLKALEADIENAHRTGVSVPQESIDAVDKLKKSVANLGQTLDAGSVKTREIHEALHLVGDAAGNALGPIAELGHFLGNPYVLAAAGAITAIKMLVQQHEELREIHIKNIALSQDLENALRDTGEAAARESASNVAALADHFRRLGENIDVATQSLHRFMAANAAAAASQEANLTTTNALIAAYVHEQEILGHFTEPQAHALTERNRSHEEREHERIAEQRQQRDIDAQQDRAEGLQDERAQAQAQATALQPQHDQADAAAKATATRVKNLTDTLAALDQTATENIADLPGLKDQAKRARDFAESGEGEERDPDAGAKAEKLERLVKDAIAKIAAPGLTRDEITRLTASQTRFEQAATRIQTEIEHQTRIAEQRFTDLRSTLETNRTATQALHDQHGDFQRDQPRREETRRVARRTELEEKHNAHTASDAEERELAGMIDGNHPGEYDAMGHPRTARTDLTDLNRQARELENRLQHQRPQDRSPIDIAQLSRLMDRFSGFLENNDPQIRVLAEAMHHILDRATQTESQVSNTTQIVATLQQRVNQRGQQ